VSKRTTRTSGNGAPNPTETAVADSGTVATETTRSSIDARVPVILEYLPADTSCVDDFRCMSAVICDADDCGLVVETAGRLDSEQPVLIRSRDRSELPFKREDRTHAEVIWSRRIKPPSGIPFYHCGLQFYETTEGDPNRN
jgi:hypothetical protein